MQPPEACIGVCRLLLRCCTRRWHLWGQSAAAWGMTAAATAQHPPASRQYSTRTDLCEFPTSASALPSNQVMADQELMAGHQASHQQRWEGGNCPGQVRSSHEQASKAMKSTQRIEMFDGASFCVDVKGGKPSHRSTHVRLGSTAPHCWQLNYNKISHCYAVSATEDARCWLTNARVSGVRSVVGPGH